MQKASKLAQVLKEMEVLNIEILSLSETRWPHQVERTYSNGSMLMFPGKSEREE